MSKSKAVSEHELPSHRSFPLAFERDLVGERLGDVNFDLKSKGFLPALCRRRWFRFDKVTNHISDNGSSGGIHKDNREIEDMNPKTCFCEINL